MAKTIEIYVMNKEVITQTSLDGRPLVADSVHYCTMKLISKTEKIVSEDDKEALQLVEKIATEKGFKVQIIDVASFKGKVKARLKGVKTTPTIIAGNKRIVGVPKKEELEALLSQ